MANNSDSSSKEEHPPKKCCHQPDPVEIVEADKEESEGVIKVVDEGNGGEENDDDVDDDDKEDGLQEQHHANIPVHAKVKKDSTKDLPIVFGECIPVTFKKKGGGMETLTGCWCNICRLVGSSHINNLIESYNLYPGLTETLFEPNPSEKCSLRAVTCHATVTFNSIMITTARSVRRGESRSWNIVYLSISCMLASPNQRL